MIFIITLANYIAIAILNILALLLLSYLVYNNKTLDKNRNRALLFTIFILIIIILSEIATTSNVGERVVYRNLNNLANVVGFSLSDRKSVV